MLEGWLLLPKSARKKIATMEIDKRPMTQPISFASINRKIQKWQFCIQG